MQKARKDVGDALEEGLEKAREECNVSWVGKRHDFRSDLKLTFADFPL